MKCWQEFRSQKLAVGFSEKMWTSNEFVGYELGQSIIYGCLASIPDKLSFGCLSVLPSDGFRCFQSRKI